MNAGKNKNELEKNATLKEKSKVRTKNPNSIFVCLKENVI